MYTNKHWWNITGDGENADIFDDEEEAPLGDEQEDNWDDEGDYVIFLLFRMITKSLVFSVS